MLVLRCKKYVLVNTREPLVELFRREKAPMWSYYTFGENEMLSLTSINVMLPMNEIYENINFLVGISVLFALFINIPFVDDSVNM